MRSLSLLLMRISSIVTYPPTPRSPTSMIKSLYSLCMVVSGKQCDCGKGYGGFPDKDDWDSED
jgi:hypothetical protein